MKFKIIFILFNLVILFSFAIIFFMPMATLGWDVSAAFWSENWYLPVLFLFVLAVLNSYFIMNWKLFSLLEQENWESIVETVLASARKGRFRRQDIRIFVNAALVSSRLEALEELGTLVAKEKPALAGQFALEFGIPFVLGSKPEAMEEHFGRWAKTAGGAVGEWIRWYHAFALVLGRKPDAAAETLRALCADAVRPLVRMLALYLCFSIGTDPELAKLADEGRKEFSGNLPEAQARKLVEKGKHQIQVVILGRLVGDALAWMYKPSTADAGEGEST